MENSETSIERRVLTDNDANLVVDSVVETFKFGVVVLSVFNGTPLAGAGLSLAAGLGGALLKKQESKISAFLKLWKHKIEQFSSEDRDQFRKNVQTEAGERIVEEAWKTAASCIDPEKLDYLAELLSNGLASKLLAEHQIRRLITLLDTLDVVDFVILQSKLKENRKPLAYIAPEEAVLQQEKFSSFRAKHAVIFADENEPLEPREPRSNYWHPTELTPEEKLQHQLQLREYHQARERHALFQNRIHRLIELGVLGVREDYPYHVEAGLTPLGMALLKIIGVAPDDEWGEANATSSLETAQQLKKQAETNQRTWQNLDKKEKEQKEREANQAYEALRQIKNHLR